MAEDQTFFQGCENITDSPGAESLVSVPPQDTLMENSDCDQENWHVRFRTFSSSEESDPIKDLKRLRELCHLWLRPDLHTKEQMMDRLVLEQFMICMPLECQVLLKETGVQSCKDLEDVLRNKQKPKNWVSKTLVMGVGQGDTCKLQGSQDRTCGFGSVSVVPKQVREVHSWAIWEILFAVSTRRM